MIAGGLMVAGLSVTSPMPAMAYDPCQRATQEAQEAEDRFWRWCANHDKRYGACTTPPGSRGAELMREWNEAERRRSRECS